MNKNLYMIPKNYLPIFVTMLGPVSVLAFIGVFFLPDDFPHTCV